ncbi:MAG: metallophosphoesterase [Candidatus Korarchaeota archaeon]
MKLKIVSLLRNITTMVLEENPISLSFMAFADLHQDTLSIVDAIPQIEDELGLTTDIIIIAGDIGANEKRSLERKDVEPIYEIFRNRGYNVVGVLGNHDFVKRPMRHNILHGDVIEIKGLKFGGISGIIGMPWLPGRVSTEDYIHMYLKMINTCDVLLTHEPPHLKAFSPSPHRKHISNYIGNNTGKLLLHVYGHIDPMRYGCMLTKINKTVLLNAYRKVIIGIA